MCVYYCVGFVMCGFFCVGFVICGCVYKFGFCNVLVCVYLWFCNMWGFVYFWIL